MKTEKLNDLVETVGKYLSENNCEISLTAERLIEEKDILDKTTDAVIALICKIGVDENFAPNMHGIILDQCLESLNQIREEYFKNE